MFIGLDSTEANYLLPFSINTHDEEHIATYFEGRDAETLFAGISSADVHNRAPRAVPLVTGGASRVGNGVMAISESGNVAFCQIAPWHFDPQQSMNLKRTFRRFSFALSRLIGNLGAARSSLLLKRISTAPREDEKRWLEGFYLVTPEEWDDPYRFFRW